MENRSEKRFGKGGERYFNRWLAWMRSSIKDIAADSLKRFAKKEKADWLEDDPA